MRTPDHPKNETLRLSALEAAQLLDTPPEERFDRITRLAARTFDVPICLVSLIDKDRQWFKSCYGLGVRETARDISFCGHAILGADTFVVENALQDERFADNPLVTGEPDIRFYAGAPLEDRNGFRLGTLCLIDKKPRTFSSDDQKTLRDFADLVEREFQYQELGTYYSGRTQALNILNDISLDSSGSVSERIERALAIATQYLKLETAIVSNITGGVYTILWHHERHPTSLENGTTFPLEQTYCSLLAAQGSVLAINHMARSRFSEHPCYRQFRLESYLAAPVWIDDELFGTLNFSSPIPVAQYLRKRKRHSSTFLAAGSPTSFSSKNTRKYSTNWSPTRRACSINTACGPTAIAPFPTPVAGFKPFTGSPQSRRPGMLRRFLSVFTRMTCPLSPIRYSHRRRI